MIPRASICWPPGPGPFAREEFARRRVEQVHVFNERAAYDWCCELSIYLDHHAQRQGLGRQLYAALETKLKKMGITNCYACIAYPQQEDTYLNDHSARFHEHLGFQTVGYFHQCGYKFGRWYDMIWMEKMIGEHPDKVDPVRFSRS